MEIAAAAATASATADARRNSPDISGVLLDGFTYKVRAIIFWSAQTEKHATTWLALRASRALCSFPCSRRKHRLEPLALPQVDDLRRLADLQHVERVGVVVDVRDGL